MSITAQNGRDVQTMPGIARSASRQLVMPLLVVGTLVAIVALLGTGRPAWALTFAVVLLATHSIQKRSLAHPLSLVVPMLMLIFWVTPLAIWSGESSLAVRFGGSVSDAPYLTSLALASVGFGSGLWIGMRRRAPVKGARLQTAVSGSVLRTLGLAVLAVVLVIRVVTTASAGVFSFDQVSENQAVEAAIASLLILGLCSYSVGEVLRGRARPARLAVVLLGLLLIAYLVTGSRSEFFPLFVIPFLTFSSQGSVIRYRTVVLTALVGLLVLGALVDIRQGRSINLAGDDGELIDVVLDPLASATLVWVEGHSAVNASGEFFNGSTYLSSLPQLLPRPFSDIVGVESGGSATQALRDVLNYSGTSGLGFSAPLEWYLNFGHFGDVALSFLYGLGFAIAFRAYQAQRSVMALALYPVLVGRLPLAARSDWLQLTNGLILTFGALFLFSLLLRRERGRQRAVPLAAPT